MRQVDDTISISERVSVISSLLGCDETTVQNTCSRLEEIIGSNIASVEIFPDEHRRILTVTDTEEISYYAVIEKGYFISAVYKGEEAQVGGRHSRIPRFRGRRRHQDGRLRGRWTDSAVQYKNAGKLPYSVPVHQRKGAVRDHAGDERKTPFRSRCFGRTGCVPVYTDDRGDDGGKRR